MCNWVGSILFSSLCWAVQDAICDIMIGSKDSSEDEESSLKKDQGQIKSKIIDSEKLTPVQITVVCIFCAFLIGYCFSLYIMFNHQEYLNLYRDSSLIFRKTYDLRFFFLLMSGLFCFLHYHYLSQSFETSSSTVILPLAQFSSIVVFPLSAVQKYLLGEVWLQSYFHLLSFLLILIGGILPATDGHFGILFQKSFWNKPFIKNVLKAEFFHSFYNLSIASAENFDQENFRISFYFEFFTLTRFLFVLSIIFYFFGSDKTRQELMNMRYIKFRTLLFSAMNEFLTLTGYFFSAFAYQCYYQTGVVTAAECSMNQLLNLIIAFVLKKKFNIGRKNSIQIEVCIICVHIDWIIVSSALK